MTPFEHAMKIREINTRLSRLLRKAKSTNDELCAAMSDAAQAACEANLMTAQETSNVVAPKD